MRYVLILFALLIAVLLVFSCGKDKTTEPDNTVKLQRIVATAGTSAPPLNTTESAIWNVITPVTVTIPPLTVPTPSMGSIATIEGEASLQALTFNDSLYLRITWEDNTHDVWRAAYLVKDTTDSAGSQPVTMFNTPDSSYGHHEDQLWLLFSGLANGDWDGLNWRVLTTGPAFMAEGINLHRTSPAANWISDPDTSDMTISRTNKHSFYTDPLQPAYFHKDSSQYRGYILYEDDLLSHSLYIRGWKLDQYVPFYIFDSTKHSQPKSVRNSRWDTEAIGKWDSLQVPKATYTVVLCRPMNTGYNDDVQLIDSIKAKIGVFDNMSDLYPKDGSHGFSNEFWLIF